MRARGLWGGVGAALVGAFSAGSAHAQATAPLAPLPQSPAPAPAPPPPAVVAPAAVPPPPPPPAMPQAEPPTFDGTGAPPSITQVGMPPPPPPMPPPSEAPCPIDCTGPGTFTHDGFYLRFSLDVGALGARGTSVGRTVSAGGAAAGGSLLLGGTPSRGFVVGGIVSGISVSSPSTTNLPANVTDLSSGVLGVFADWYPNEHRGWHVGGALGIGFTSLDFGSTTWTAAGLGGKVAGGYDFWIGPQWSLGLQAGLDFATQGNLEDSNRNETGYSLGSLGLTLGVAFVYH